MKKYLVLCVAALVCFVQMAFAQPQVYTPFVYKQVQPPLPVKPMPPVSANLKPVYIADKDPYVTMMNHTQDLITKSMANCPALKNRYATIVLSAERANNFTANLKWETKYAFKASGFSVERSLSDTFHFIAQNFAPASAGRDIKRDYQLPDHNDYSGISFYRVRQVNFDTSYIYSNIVLVKGYDSLPFRVYPNPALNRVWIEVTTKLTGNATIMLYDASGKILQQQALNCAKGLLTKQSFDISRFGAGLYQVKILMPDKTFVTGKFIKE